MSSPRAVTCLVTSARLLLSRCSPRTCTMFSRGMATIAPPACLFQEIEIPKRELFGPGPSTMPASIGQMQSRSLLGYLHPEFIKIMADVRLGIQYVFQTKNAYTMCVSGTGHSGMEASLFNLLERGETLLVIQGGLWGQRAADIGKRLGLNVQVVEIPLGTVISKDAFQKAVSSTKPAVVYVCHGDSSTGVVQPLEGLSEICHQQGALLLVDTVASLGGTPFSMDRLGVDCVYSATQKVLNAPPGLAPISYSDRAIEKIKSRKERVASFYYDALELGNYWGCDGTPPRYHHTAPISTVYALREALAIVAKKGIDELVEQHRTTANMLYEKLEEEGFSFFVKDKADRLPCLHTILVPGGVDWKAVQSTLFAQGIEVSGGLGATVGKIFRIGTFGGNSEPHKVASVLDSFISVVKSHSKI